MVSRGHGFGSPGRGPVSQESIAAPAQNGVEVGVEVEVAAGPGPYFFAPCSTIR